MSSDVSRDHLEAYRDPIDVRRDPVDVSRDRIDVRCEPVYVRHGPVDVRRGSVVKARRNPGGVRRDPVDVRRDPVVVRRDPVDLSAGQGDVISPLGICRDQVTANQRPADFCREPVGERLPRNYQVILATIRDVAQGTHLTAHDVYVRARVRAPKLGFATVHRGLGRLNELGYVFKVDVPGAASAVYEPVAAPHAHFRCTRCGSIHDVDFTVPRELLAALAARHGVEIAAEATTFAGRCAACAAS